MAEKKTKIDNSLLRVPQPKKKLGLKVPTIRMPHEDLIKPEFPKVVETVTDNQNVQDSAELQTSQSSHTSVSRQTSHTSLSSHTRDETPDVKRNYQKISNSVTDVAIPNGLFKPGKSKLLYDILLGITRGDFPAKFSVRMPKGKLMKLAKIGSRVTFDECITHLESVGLVKVGIRIGEHEGNVYEVFFPHEINLATLPSHTSHTSQSRQTSSTQNLDRLVTLESSVTSLSSNPTNTGVSDTLKTIIKTNTIDDEAFTVFSDLSLKLTGKKASEKDYLEFIKTVLTEIEAAASKTSVSSFAAFAQEVVVRRVRAFEPKKKGTETKKDTVGKFTGEIDIDKEYQALLDLLEFEPLEQILAKLDTYDYPDEVKRELKAKLGG